MLEVSSRDGVIEQVQEDESPFEERVSCVRYERVSLAK